MMNVIICQILRWSSEEHLASVVESSHPALSQPDNPGHYGETEDDALEQREHADAVHLTLRGPAFFGYWSSPLSLEERVAVGGGCLLRIQRKELI